LSDRYGIIEFASIVVTGWIYIQATTMNCSGKDHNKKLNLKARLVNTVGFLQFRNYFKYASSVVPKQNAVLAFISLYNFEVSKKTKNQIEQTISRGFHCVIIQGEDIFPSQELTLPFHILYQVFSDIAFYDFRKTFCPLQMQLSCIKQY
jgi:hypothetical protein